MTYPTAIKRLVSDFTSRRPMRSTSLIITIFGDTVSQHGHTIWLGSLVQAMAPLGINERLVRTSVFRLVQDGWLEAQRIGRRSFYRFSAHGSNQYRRAARRIYALDKEIWQGNWQLVLPQDIEEPRRERLRRSLHWLGYRLIASGTYARPDTGGHDLLDTLQEFGVSDDVITFQAETAPFTTDLLLRNCVRDAWQLDDVARSYRQFIRRYKPLLRACRQPLSAEAAFTARTLLIHDYRRILLNDTPLPAQLLPRAWPGEEALTLTSTIYRALAPASMEFIQSTLATDAGPMPAAGSGFARRFARIA